MGKVKNFLRKAISTGLIITASHLPMSCASFFKPKPKPPISIPIDSPVYKYAISKGLEKKVAGPLAIKLDSLDGNTEEFINIISDYSQEVQEASVKSSILDNGHISSRELENTRKATLSGIINPEEIYAVLANGADGEGGYSVTDLLFFYKLLKDNNVKDENITLLLYNKLHKDYTNTQVQKILKANPRRLIGSESNKKIKEYISTEINKKIKEYASLTKDEIEIDSEEVTAKTFLKSIKSLKSDYNDKAYIYYVADAGKNHLVFNKIWENNRSIYDPEYGKKKGLTNRDFNKAINSLEYEKLIIVGDTCYSSSLLKNLDKPNKIKNTLAIASSKSDQKSYGGWAIGFIIKYEKYKTFSGIFNNDINPEDPIIPFYFDTKKRECTWLDEPFIEPQE